MREEKKVKEKIGQWRLVRVLFLIYSVPLEKSRLDNSNYTLKNY
jgi:hypothetical protein